MHACRILHIKSLVHLYNFLARLCQTGEFMHVSFLDPCDYSLTSSRKTSLDNKMELSSVVKDTETKVQVKELPYLENELWHKIFGLTDLETCRANNRVAFYDMLCKDLETAWSFLCPDDENDKCEPIEPLQPPRDWPMMILLLQKKEIADTYKPRLCALMVRYKNPILMKEARQAGCPWSKNVIISGVERGSIECLKWAYENGCMENEKFSYTETAAELGRLEVLQCFHQCGFPWRERTMFCALNGGHLACLRFAHENGCPWSSNLLYTAVYVDMPRSVGDWEEKGEELQTCVQYIIDCDRAPYDPQNPWQTSTPKIRWVSLVVHFKATQYTMYQRCCTS